MGNKEFFKNPGVTKRILIIGAGQGGTMLAKNLQNASNKEVQPVGFIDDDLNKKNFDYLGNREWKVESNFHLMTIDTKEFFNPLMFSPFDSSRCIQISNK